MTTSLPRTEGVMDGREAVAASGRTMEGPGRPVFIREAAGIEDCWVQLYRFRPATRN